MGTSTTATKAPSCTGAFVVRGTAGVMAHTAAPIEGTGLPVGAELRLRPLGTGAGRRGWAYAAVATDVQLNNDTPGDLPPRDPLS